MSPIIAAVHEFCVNRNWQLIYLTIEPVESQSLGCTCLQNMMSLISVVSYFAAISLDVVSKLQKPKRSPKGGRPPAPNREVLEGILWMLRTGARWCDLPSRYPSASTCWRRLKLWEEHGVWLDIWRTFFAQMDAKSALDWEETFIDGSFAPAKKRPRRRENQEGQGYEVDGGGRRQRYS